MGKLKPTAPSQTPALRQYWQVKEQYPDAIVLFRLGDFYEIFFHDAEIAAPIMGITLTSRPHGKSGRHPMCGVPHHAWESYVGKLLQAGHKVVICDQVEEKGKGLVKRAVTRILSPGTVMEEAYLNPNTSNYLVATFTQGNQSGLAALELSRGELLLCQMPTVHLALEIQRLAPTEILNEKTLDAYRFDFERGKKILKDKLGVEYLESIGAQEANLAVGAAAVAVEYALSHQIRLQPGALRIRTYSLDQNMNLDSPTREKLEIETLIRLVDRTQTPMGARMMRSWLQSPLIQIAPILARQVAVAELTLADATLSKNLEELGDIERVCMRAVQGFARASELLALCHWLVIIEKIKTVSDRFQSPLLARLAAEVQREDALMYLLSRALLDSPTADSFIRPGFDSELDEIWSSSQDARHWIEHLENDERERLGIRTLKVGYNRVFGYYLEVSSSQLSKVPPEYIRKQTIAQGERYFTQELKTKEVEVLSAKERARARQEIVFQLLLESVRAIAERLLTTAAACGELDALNSFARSGQELAWVRPEMETSTFIEISAGRHPLVEKSLPENTFVSNDLLLGGQLPPIMILTGPNMAGKSTYLRQAALIVVLAQAGACVPAQRVRLGLVDRIFTRIGSRDDLSAGQSTFMVEMTETANILNHATSHSLVILDEVGRGTSTYDGLSIAQAVVEYIHSHLRCRTLFATHYHELTALQGHLSGITNARVEVLEEGDQIRFLHKVVPGGADRSYGIHVAALAGLPRSLIGRAREVLGNLETKGEGVAPSSRPTAPDPKLVAMSDTISGLKIDTLTPIEALTLLDELQKELREK